ncbi:dihydrofolate reductase family protein [Micromonospora carbonacea]|uniref:dihydrofolate reductase family protein n=1 Tax=Micromonospora carbonacea TaxID=47853 RepID=UPI003724AF5A
MSEIVVDAFVTLDGVMQAPGSPDEDRDGGFPHGGWQVPYMDRAAVDFVNEGIVACEGLLLGRRTYEVFARHFPVVPADHPDAAAAAALNAMPKHVASRTLRTADWENSTLLGADTLGAIARLRARPGGELHVVGSAGLLRTLVQHDLVDVYRIMVFPVVLGSGKRLFAEAARAAAFSLVDSRATAAGALVCTYRRAGEVTYGSHGDG